VHRIAAATEREETGDGPRPLPVDVGRDAIHADGIRDLAAGWAGSVGRGAIGVVSGGFPAPRTRPSSALKARAAELRFQRVDSGDQEGSP
jgi:hypothetical protein